MSFDDWLYGLTQRFSPRPMFPKEHVLSIWNGELDQTREWGGLVTMVMHPQVTGRPMRLGIFRDFISRARGFGDVWIATGQEIAEHFVFAGESALRPLMPACLRGAQRVSRAPRTLTIESRTMSRIVYVNGAYLPEEDAKISIFDRGFIFGDGIYEVSAVLGGKLVDCEAHLARLERSCGEIRLCPALVAGRIGRDP